MTQTTENTDFPEKLYKSDCSDAKSHIEFPLSQEYVARLESVAKAALKYWKHTDAVYQAAQTASSELFDALDSIDLI